MSLSNLSELLLRNQTRFSGRVLLMDPPDDLTLAGWGKNASGLSTDYGQWQRGRDRGESWLFGYDDETRQESFDQVVIAMPKAKAELALRMAYAASVLTPGGKIWLAGEKRGGIAGGAKTFKTQWAHASKADNARHCQLWAASPVDVGPGSFDLEDWFGKDTLAIAGQSLTIAALPGVFSQGRLDPGTALLLESFENCPGEPVLDFGCGAGVIGAWLLQRWPELKIDLLDAQWQALTCARRTLGGERPNVRVLPSDGLTEVAGQYKMIVSNPPFHQGVRSDLSVTMRFLQEVKAHLQLGGELRIVANRHLPYAEQIEKTIGKVTVLADDNRYRVYQAKRSRRAG